MPKTYMWPCAMLSMLPNAGWRTTRAKYAAMSKSTNQSARQKAGLRLKKARVRLTNNQSAMNRSAGNIFKHVTRSVVMLDSLKQTGKNIGRELSRTWESLSEGWRELLSRSGNALTHFSRNKDETQPEKGALATSPRWSLLAGEVEETDREIVVRVEVPGMDKKDCRITI